MAWILSIETASVNCSVSIFQGNSLKSFREDPSPEYTHGELLHIFIDEALKEANIQPHQLSAVAVSKGPGSYTGLRIGVSAAKGLCFALGIPLISLPTLLVLGKALSNPEGILIPMLDARRMEVYSAVYDANLNSIRETRAEILNEDSFSDYLQSKVVHLLGSGASKCQELFKRPNFEFHPELMPSSLNMGELAFKAFNEKHFEDLAYFEPYYLKDFIATQKIVRD